MSSIERTILSHLVYNEPFARRVLPFIKDEYFHDLGEKTVYKLIQDYVNKYNNMPSKEVLSIELSNDSKLNQMTADSCKEIIGSLATDATDVEWLVDSTEKFCQEKAVYNAIMASITILDKKDKTADKGAIPALLTEALGISFDVSVGHDYLADAEERYDYYHQIHHHIAFDLDYLNKITKGGLVKKTLNVALAGTGVGKSLFMCHCAAYNLTQGKNVLYITLELAEKEVAKRIDANLLSVTMDDLAVMPKEIYDKKIARLKSKTAGKLVIKEYPTTSAGAAHFRHLLNELRLKQNFTPDIIYIDYINICCSSRIKPGVANSYTYIKSIAEELRGLAVEFNLPIMTATQTTRSGYSNSDVDLTDTSESFGLPATADLMFALIVTEELTELGQIMVKQLKNRYNDPTIHKRFVIGVNRAKMQLFDCEQEAQDDIVDDRPAFDKTAFGRGDDDRSDRKTKLQQLTGW